MVYVFGDATYSMTRHFAASLPAYKIPLYSPHNFTALLQFLIPPSIPNDLMAINLDRTYTKAPDISPQSRVIHCMTEYYLSVGTMAI